MYVCVQTCNCNNFNIDLSSTTYRSAKEITMLETIAIILLILWALGLVSSYSMGGFIHVLLVIAVIVILIRVIQGRRL